MSDEQRSLYLKSQRDFSLAELELKRIQTLEPENKEAINAVAYRIVDLRQALIDLEQEQASFFNNTAEARAQQKLIQWLVLHLSYFKPTKPEGESDWVLFFTGKTSEEKLACFDSMVEAKDELLNLSNNMLEFLATILASTNGNLSKEDLESFVSTLKG